MVIIKAFTRSDPKNLSVFEIIIAFTLYGVMLRKESTLITAHEDLR